MTRWRIGYGAGAQALINAINNAQSQMSSCPSWISQAAALTGDQGRVDRAVAV